MDEALSKTVSKVFCEVLEKQVFMFADPAGPEEFEGAEGEFFSVSMGFKGEIEGSLTMAVPASLLPEIAANFLGMDADDPAVEARSRDACKELLNVTCGHLLTTLRGDEPVFDLSIPELAGLPPATLSDWSCRPESLRFSVEGSPLLLMVGIGNGAAGAPPAPGA